MKDLSVFSNQNALEAYLFVPEECREEYPDVDEFVATLQKHGVVYGIKRDILERMVVERACNDRILVAEGRPPVAGVDGRLEMLIDVTNIGKPKELENGRVDHKELKKVINVKKGQPLMRRIPPQPGKPGRTVFGKEILPPKPGDPKLLASNGTIIPEEDLDLLCAATDGAVFLSSTDILEIKTAKLINGDIDYATGNISFFGDLKITGTVRAGFSINADGDLFIGGSVEGSEVTCSGDMEIVGGAIGSGNGKITCAGNLKVRLLENFIVNAGKNVFVSDSIMRSKVRAEGKLKAQTIVGGEIDASHGVDVDVIGSSAEIKTVIKVGSTFFLMQQQKLLDEKNKELCAAIDAGKKVMFELVRDGMDEHGRISEPDSEKLLELKTEKWKQDAQLKVVTERMAELNDTLQQNPDPVVHAKQIFPNTIIRFGLLEKIVKTTLSHVVINSRDNKINIARG